MSVMRGTPAAGAAAVLLVVGSGMGASAGTGDGGSVGAVAPEADVAHHGYVSLSDGRLGVSVMSRNHGPSSITSATVRLEFSLRPVGDLRLPRRCLWAAERVVLCATGPLSADGVGRTVTLDLRTHGTSSEGVVTVATVWNGGASDRNPANNEHQVLVPATGDRYAF